MNIDGKFLAEQILKKLRAGVIKLKQKGVTPTIAVIQVGDDPGSTAYIRQKQKAAEQIGAKLLLSRQSSVVSRQQLENSIKQYNNDPKVHGIILQRPLPGVLDAQSTSLCSAILPTKDVDGFLPDSPYRVPVASAVITILRFAFSQLDQLAPLDQFDSWLEKQSIVVLGRGDTAGKPIADLLIKRDCNVTVVHSQTPNPDTITKTADVLISCVGKTNIVRRDTIKPGIVLISVGITRGADGKLHGDYEEDHIKDLASLYTPTPGGVGPVNVACLMENLLQAASNVL
ncbi:MAG: bifunctional 5,10-methylenetetrahydrofolate dehydrogenase/5,10-methenyltetrahydrofolate cyclohydrolase [Candidatus Gottesmanbacteria bacterium]|nr:bifunctional 5,10-methylenetetrahydrofolate dehydrogenase/5,10-methenyltetrahydrofolate cyclohydrolase [Candidatus Gottesmanbacteria bacterium]